MKRLLLALPPLLLLLSLDRLGPTPGIPPAPAFVRDWNEAAPSLPGVNEGRGGWPGDPLNLVFVASPDALRRTLTQAGWTEVPRTLRGSLAACLSELLAGRRPASFPPMNDYALRGRRQDMNWAIPVRGIGERHHFRLWCTGQLDARGRCYWWGTGNYDRSIRRLDLSRRPDPDMDRERDFVLDSLGSSPLVEIRLLAPLPQIPAEGVNDKGYAYRTDGRVGVAVLRSVGPLIRRPPGAAAEGAGPSSSSRPRSSLPSPTPRPTSTP